MIQRITIVLLVLCTAAAAETLTDEVEEAKQDAIAPEFDQLRTPDSPAFSILGVAPSEVERPNTPRALVLAIGAFSKDAGKDVLVPDSFALEVNPYSLFSKRPYFDYEGGFSASALVKNLTISVGTSSEDIVDAMTMETTSLPTRLSVGIRTRIYDGEERCGKVLEE